MIGIFLLAIIIIGVLYVTYRLANFLVCARGGSLVKYWLICFIVFVVTAAILGIGAYIIFG